MDERESEVSAHLCGRRRRRRRRECCVLGGDGDEKIEREEEHTMKVEDEGMINDSLTPSHSSLGLFLREGRRDAAAADAPVRRGGGRDSGIEMEGGGQDL